MDPILSLLRIRHARPEAAPRGFTLVEMVVVLAIIVVITTIAVTGQASFNRSILLTDTAYTVAFSIREAQILGLSTRRFGDVFDGGYGVRFHQTMPTSYVLFSDTDPVSPGSSMSGVCPGHTQASGPEARPGNCLYTVSSELVRTYTLNRGFTIFSFCGTTTGGQQRCSGTGSTDLSALHISFMRPNTQAIILGVVNGTGIELTNATIRLRSPDGAAERCIVVTKAGQIGVQTCS